MNPRFWLALHALVVLVPLVALLTGAPDARLFGSDVPPQLPALTVEGWRGEKVQPAFQAWFEAKIGLRGVMVRTDNSAQVYVLGQAKPAGRFVVGHDDTLFVDDDLFYMALPESTLPAVLGKLDLLAERLGRVQSKLAARGKKLVVVLAPSKTVIYPEAVPRGFRRRELRSDVTVHEGIRASFARHHVAFGDGDALLSGKAGADRDLVFTRTGRHWTPLGACLVLRAALADGPITPTCAYAMTTAKWESDPEFDIYRVLNVWRAGAPSVQVATLDQRGKPDPAGAAARPRTLFVGTSFMWMLVDVLRPLIEAPIAFYYNQTVYDVSETLQPLEPVDPESPRWAGYALDRDLYVIEILEPYAYGDEIPAFLTTLEARLE